MNLRQSRWGRSRAAVRHHRLGRDIWNSMPVGVAVLGVVNLAQLTFHWRAYENGWIVVCVFLGLIATNAFVWFRIRVGIGLLASSAAIAAGPAACLVMSTQLDATELTGLANWVSGFSVVGILLLPFARPPEELCLGVGTLIAANFFALRDVPDTVRDMHTVVLSGGAAAAIATGASLLVFAMRQTVETGVRLSGLAREARWSQLVSGDARLDQDLRVGDNDLAAAKLLDDVAAGRASCQDPAVVDASRRLAAALRADLEQRSGASLLRDLLTTGSGARDPIVTVADDDNLGRRLRVDDQIMLVAAVREVLATAVEFVNVVVLPIDDEHAHVAVGVVGGPPPGGAHWLELRSLPDGRFTSTHPGHWFYDWVFPTPTNALEVR